MQSGDWVHEIGIPAFRPHVRRGKDGKVLYVVTPADLPEIAANSSTLTVDLHGDKPPITEGHRSFKPDAKEADQPLVLGYMDNFRIGDLPDGTPVILCDRHYMAQYADRATRHPFSSVDYLPNRKAIVGLAKLTRPPELNLGAVYYPGTSEPVYVYAMGAEMGTDKGDQDTSKPQDQGTPELTPEEQAGSEKVYAYLCKKYAWMAKCAKQFGDEAPLEPETKKEPDTEGTEKEKEEPVSNAADTTALIQKYEADLKALRDEREAEKVDRTLDHLEKVEGYQFDRDAEKAIMLPLDVAGRTARADSIRKYSRQVPVALTIPIEIYQGNPLDGNKAATQEQSRQAMAYQAKHGGEFADALAAVRSGKS